MSLSPERFHSWPGDLQAGILKNYMPRSSADAVHWHLLKTSKPSAQALRNRLALFDAQLAAAKKSRPAGNPVTERGGSPRS